MDVTALLTYEACVLGVAIKNFTTQHRDNERRCLVSRPNAVRDVTEYYCGTPAFLDLRRELSDEETNGEWVKFVTREKVLN